MHVYKRAHNAHVKIYGTHKMYVLVTYCVNKPFLNFVWLIYLDFWILAYCVFTIPFFKPFFTNTKILTIKICLVCPRVFIFFTKSAWVSDGKNLSLYRCHLCFVVIHQSNQVSLILRWNGTHSSHKNYKTCTINPFKTDKRATNDNPTLSKIGTTSKVSLELTSIIKFGRRGAHWPSSQS